MVETGIYVRVSTEEQAKEGYSIRAQIQKLKDYSRIKEWNVYKVYADEGISGKNITKRKELQKLLNNLKNYDIVLCYKLSRISRSVKDMANMLDKFKKNNVRFISLQENIDTEQATGKLLIYVISICAEIERDNISEFVKMAKKATI